MDASGRDAGEVARDEVVRDEKGVAGQARPAGFARLGDEGGEDEVAGAAGAFQLGDERGVGGMGGDDDVGAQAAEEVVERGAEREGAGLEGMAQAVAELAGGAFGGIDEIDAGLARGEAGKRGAKVKRGNVAFVAGRSREDENAFHTRVIGP